MKTSNFSIDQFLEPLDWGGDQFNSFRVHPLFKSMRGQLKENLGSIALPDKFYDQMFGQIKDLLRIDISDILGSAWLNSSEIQSMINKLNFGNEFVNLPLANHKIISEHRPYLEPFINEVQIGRIDFTVTLKLMLENVSLKLKMKQLFEAIIGRCRINITFRNQDILLLEKSNILIAENQTISFSTPADELSDLNSIPDDHHFIPSNQSSVKA